MLQDTIDRLRNLTDLESLTAYLCDDLDWPIDPDALEECTFDYDARELGLKPEHAVRIDRILQLRPVDDAQPWGIFLVQFETRRLPVVVLRRILRALTRSSRQRPTAHPLWEREHLLFICLQGEGDLRGIAFAHFQRAEGRLDALRTFSWDASEAHFYYIKNLHLDRLRWPSDPEDAESWLAQWGGAFTSEHRQVVRDAQTLAREMARHARTVRGLVREVYDLEGEGDPLHALLGQFRELLIHDLDADGFADMVAQTVAYGLFSAAMERGDRQVTYDTLVEMIPPTNPLLKALLRQLTADAIDLEELGVEQLVLLFNRTDTAAIKASFGRQSGQGREDPVIFFYELFMAEYDKEQKVRRGEFYTPDPVVSYIVRSVDEILEHELGFPDGLADTSRDPETGEFLVQILDPACGTGTFLAHVIDVIERRVKAQPGVDWSAYVRESLLPRLYGFELKMAPYVVCHLKLGLKLEQTGYDMQGDERLRVYLTNTLEPGTHYQLGLSPNPLAREAVEANRVKSLMPISVIVGNPPYSGHSANNVPWIRNLLRGKGPKGERVESYFHVDGEDLDERNPKWLNDDYVKFIRWAQWKLSDQKHGVLGYITNHGYLDNPTFRGMRQSLVAGFQRLSVIDLHGSTKKRERAPDGDADENVFDILPGVAVLLARRDAGDQALQRGDLWGSRQVKYSFLEGNSICSTKLLSIGTDKTTFVFAFMSASASKEYRRGVLLTHLMPVHSLGLLSKRDALVVGFSHRDLMQRLESFCDPANSPEYLSSATGIRLTDKDGWDLGCARAELRTQLSVSSIQPLLYRPMDPRYVYYSSIVIARPNQRVLSNVRTLSPALVVGRQGQAVGSPQWDLFTLSGGLVDQNIFRRGGGTVFPFFVCEPITDVGPAASNRRVDSTQVVANLCSDEAVRGKLVQMTNDHPGSIPGGLEFQRNLMHYISSVLSSQTFRLRYADFLKSAFPRIPLTSDPELFRALSALGADIVALHLLDEDYPHASWNREGGSSPLADPPATFVSGANGRQMGQFSKARCCQDGRVLLDTADPSHCSYFDGVPPEVWEFQIGGYQVCHKWLYDRRATGKTPGRVLSDEDIAHYPRIVAALQETIRLQGEIDAVIEAHGGWPIQ